MGFKNDEPMRIVEVRLNGTLLEEFAGFSKMGKIEFANEEEDEEMTREHFLDEAKKCVCTDREGQYGSPENNFGIIAEFWDSYLKSVLNLHEYDSLVDSVDVAVMMALLKIARISTGKPKADNWVDLIGYAACGGEIQFKEA